ncbi:hypothetical protein H311_02563 [Anncaliia algerae PRA109]|nr:hypothetical protein H311_02563 [Anncaliia algerae PRA109]
MELIIFLYEITKERNLIVILSIHQPSTTILRFFDIFTFIDNGKFIYHGKMKRCQEYFEEKGMITPSEITFPEFIFELTAERSSFEGINSMKLIYNKLIPKDAEKIKNSSSSINLSNSSIKLNTLKQLLKRQFIIFFKSSSFFKFVFTTAFVFFLILFTIFALGIAKKIQLSLFKEIINDNIQRALDAKFLTHFLNAAIFSFNSYLITNASISFSELRLNQSEIERGIYSFGDLLLAGFVINIIFAYVLFLSTGVFLIYRCGTFYRIFLTHGSPLMLLILLRIYFIFSLIQSEIFISLFNTFFILASFIPTLIKIFENKSIKNVFIVVNRFFGLFPENVYLKFLNYKLEKYKINTENILDTLKQNDKLNKISDKLKNKADILNKLTKEEEVDKFFNFHENMKSILLYASIYLLFIFIFMYYFYKRKYPKYVRMRLNK